MKNIDIEDYNGTYVITGKRCPICGKYHEIVTKDEKVLNAIKNWMNGNGYVQDIPLPASDREILLTGINGTCWKMLSKMKKRKKSKLSAGEILSFYISIICQTFFF